MKPLLTRILGGRGVQESVKLPVPLTLNSLREHQRASVVGWVANKLGQLLQINSCNNGVLIYNSLFKAITDVDKESTEDYLIYLADKLINWIESDEDVYFNLSQMKLNGDYHEYLLQVYEMINSDHCLYFNRKPPDDKEETEDDKVWEVYRDALHAASQMKFLLIKEDDLPKYKEGKILCSEPVVEKIDIPRVRVIAKEALEQEGYARTTVSSYVLLISEAITNIIKHAKDGRLLIVRNDKSLNIIIEDTGSGFPLKTLPYTVLMAGYSTKKSLGQGFTLMMKLATRVLLKTSSSGSTIVLVFEKNEGEDSGKIAKSS